MYCESCGSFIPDGQAFCSNCGAKAKPPVFAGAAYMAQPEPKPEHFEQLEPLQPLQPDGQPGQPSQPTTINANLNNYYAQNDVLTEIPRVVNRKAKLGLIFGIVAMVTMFIPLCNIVPAIIGVIFSLLGFSKTKELGGKGNCIAGLSLSGFAMFLWTIQIISAIVNFASYGSFFK